MKLVLATGNAGKIQEMEHFLSSVCDCVSAKEIDRTIKEPEEVQETLLGNAIDKAQYYAQKTGLPCLAEDSGLFIRALDGWPGVRSARVAPDHQSKVETALSLLVNTPDYERDAAFHSCLAYVDPRNSTVVSVTGITEGMIVTPTEERDEHAWGYNNVFLVPSVGKTYAQMSIEEKNNVSHRGKALRKILPHLELLAA